MYDGLRGTSVEEVVNKSTVETLVRIGGKGYGRYSVGCAIQLVATAGYDAVYLLAVVGGDVLDVGDIFKTTFNFERGCTGVDEFFQTSALVEVFERKKVLVFDNAFAVAVDERVWQATTLCTLATIGTATVEGSTQVALSAVAHT